MRAIDSHAEDEPTRVIFFNNTGYAYMYSEATLIQQPDDPYAHGIA
jgi:proline racemase